MLQEHQRVVLAENLPAERLESGDVGTIVHVYRDGVAFEVEFLTLDGHTLTIVTVDSSQVRPVTSGDLTHARLIEQST